MSFARSCIEVRPRLRERTSVVSKPAPSSAMSKLDRAARLAAQAHLDVLG